MQRPEPDEVRRDLDYSAELAERVNREAREATRLPWWFWEAAVVVFVGVIAASAAWPMGLAS